MLKNNKKSLMQELFIQINNIKIRVLIDYPKYYDYLCLHFNKVILPAPISNYEIEVKAYWKMDFLGNNPPNLKENYFDDFETIGSTTLLKDRELIRLEKIRKRRFRFEFKLQDRKLMVKAIYHNKVLKNILQNLFGKTNDMLLSDLTYYFVYYPAFWYLENFRDIHILHAAAVNVDGATLVFLGLEGMGKTTLSLGLLGYPKATFIAENLIFYDSVNIYPCYQPLKLRPRENFFLHHKLKKIKEFKLKTFYELKHDFKQLPYKPDIFLFLKFGKKSYFQEIDKEEFIHRTYNTNLLVWELENYQHYAQLLNLIYPYRSFEEIRLNSLRKLINNARSYLFSIKRGEKIEETVDRIKQLLYDYKNENS